MNKRGQAALLIAAVVSVVAIIGLVLANPSSSGAPVVKGLAGPDYTQYGVRSEADQTGWDLGLVLGARQYTSNQGNRACITECGPRCEMSFTGKEVNDCFTFCKSACEKTQREITMTGGYTTP